MNQNVRLLILHMDHSDAGLGERLTRNPAVTLVGHAHSLDEAVRLTNEHRPTVALAELGSWDTDALDFCRGFRAATDVPVIVLASFMDTGRWDELSRAGATELVLRDIDTEKLVGTLLRYAP